MIDLFFKILDWTYNPLLKGLKWSAKKTQLHWFRLKDRKSPFDETKAIQLAYSVLGGSVAQAISYRNHKSKNLFIAAIRGSSDEAYDFRVYILEQLGKTYKVIWSSEELYFNSEGISLEARDIDGDGIKEIIYEQESYGSGAGSKSLIVYSMNDNRVYHITENYNWSDSTSPNALIEMDLGDEEITKQGIIECAVRRGFLQEGEPVDFDNPKFAINRWHKENGSKLNGIIKTHLYDGLPPHKSSIGDVLETKSITWTSFFKGPLYGYIKSDDKHFIAYSPAWVYEWVKCLASDGKHLWFGVHCLPGLFSFDYERHLLTRFCAFANSPLPEIRELTFISNKLVLNEIIEISAENIHRLERCKESCFFAEEHTLFNCQSERHSEEFYKELKTYFE